MVLRNNYRKSSGIFSLVFVLAIITRVNSISINQELHVYSPEILDDTNNEDLNDEKSPVQFIDDIYKLHSGEVNIENENYKNTKLQEHEYPLSVKQRVQRAVNSSLYPQLGEFGSTNNQGRNKQHQPYSGSQYNSRYNNGGNTQSNTGFQPYGTNSRSTDQNDNNPSNRFGGSQYGGQQGRSNYSSQNVYSSYNNDTNQARNPIGYSPSNSYGCNNSSNLRNCNNNRYNSSQQSFGQASYPGHNPQYPGHDLQSNSQFPGMYVPPSRQNTQYPQPNSWSNQSQNYSGQIPPFPGRNVPPNSQNFQYPGHNLTEKYPSRNSQNDSRNPSQNSQYPGFNSPYRGQNSQNPGQNSQYPGQNFQYPGHNSQYPGHNSQYPGHNSQYPSQNSQYPGQNSQYPSRNSQNSSQTPQYPGQSSQNLVSPYTGQNSQYPQQNLQNSGYNSGQYPNFQNQGLSSPYIGQNSQHPQPDSQNSGYKPPNSGQYSGYEDRHFYFPGTTENNPYGKISY